MVGQIREKGHPDHNDDAFRVLYSSNRNLFSVRLHYKCRFVSNPKLSYVDGKVEYFDPTESWAFRVGLRYVNLTSDHKFIYVYFVGFGNTNSFNDIHDEYGNLKISEASIEFLKAKSIERARLSVVVGDGNMNNEEVVGDGNTNNEEVVGDGNLMNEDSEESDKQVKDDEVPDEDGVSDAYEIILPTDIEEEKPTDGNGGENVEKEEPTDGTQSGTKKYRKKRRYKDDKLCESDFHSGNTTFDSDGDVDIARLNEVARKKKMYVRFNEKNMKNSKLFPGLVFFSSEQFKEVMRWYAATRRKDIWYSCNEKHRFGARCKFPCKWSVWMLREKKLNDTDLVIKTMSRKHKNYLSIKRRRLVKSTWLAKVLEDWFRLLLDMSLNVFKIAVEKKFGLMITSNQARRAREKALLAIQGDHEDQYNLIWDYIDELKRTHPGSTVFAEYDDD
ncbi:hypothetical protein LIER_19238 [Lithospermum erythrorhizon]|uniref:Transposase MuDR plant domain-containing protein n=1 Tax=Lithospermum erythrorhizon TaxID=34254 RepID=A0AAV3QH21_LITER